MSWHRHLGVEFPDPGRNLAWGHMWLTCHMWFFWVHFPQGDTQYMIQEMGKVIFLVGLAVSSWFAVWTSIWLQEREVVEGLHEREAAGLPKLWASCQRWKYRAPPHQQLSALLYRFCALIPRPGQLLIYMLSKLQLSYGDLHRIIQGKWLIKGFIIAHLCSVWLGGLLSKYWPSSLWDLIRLGYTTTFHIQLLT